MTAKIRWLLALAAMFAAGQASAGARDDLDAFTRGLQGLDGRFVQEVYDLDGRLKETASGRVALSAPRLFRWEYVQPYPQLIVADGSRIWVYDPDLEQVTVRPQGAEEQNSPLVALVDPGRLERDFNVRDSGREDGLDWLLLTPKQADEASFQSASLGFAGGALARMQIVDALGQRTVIAFDGWKRNPAFPASTFSYAPPPGVDVVGGG